MDLSKLDAEVAFDLLKVWVSDSTGNEMRDVDGCGWEAGEAAPSSMRWLRGLRASPLAETTTSSAATRSWQISLFVVAARAPASAATSASTTLSVRPSSQSLLHAVTLCRGRRDVRSSAAAVGTRSSHPLADGITYQSRTSRDSAAAAIAAALRKANTARMETRRMSPSSSDDMRQRRRQMTTATCNFCADDNLPCL